MNKVVYNGCFGGFRLSSEAVRMAKRIAGEGTPWGDVEGSLDYIDEDDIPRHDPILVKVVETLGSSASGRFADLRIKEISGRVYRIDEYDGHEAVIEPVNQEWVVIEDRDEDLVLTEAARRIRGREE